MKKWIHDYGLILDAEDGQHIAELFDSALYEQGDHIVKCVNLHDELVDALHELVDAYGCECTQSPPHCPMCNARKVLNKATSVEVPQ